MVWDGHSFDISVYRSGKLQIIYKQLHGGKQIDFLLPSKIYFGVVEGVKAGNFFTNLGDVQSLTEVDVFNFPRGMKVIAEKKSSGEITFNSMTL